MDIKSRPSPGLAEKDILVSALWAVEEMDLPWHKGRA